ncbi:DUF4097 family beta strand repeat-containing protein [Oerskovia merdavium]|uniref:DUF4097 family beta strand repeat protein n=1 Tax=Oerskovia merdavium TaxID=2762227 RepID=A0ABR8TXT4_9CELL|nr:DUF4097 family beta strand repeat-containing protein [Oerskovia merdavium]MBD7980129.1 DUF4097 family beta strand repeat protein [Oerskovia merdavium]
MQATHRRLATAGFVAVAALALGACGFGPRSSATDTYTEDAGITAVRIDLEAGSVTLRGSDPATGLSIERTVDFVGEYPAHDTHRVEDGVLVLAGCGRHCSASYTVDLPAGLPVMGETSHGSIDLDRTGAVDVRTSNGSVTLAGIDAKVLARTSNGKISGTGLGGTEGVDVETSNGSIELTLSTPQDVSATTDNGTVHLTVPEGSYRVSATTDLGGTDVSVPDDPDGEHHLVAGSSNGRVTVAQG